MPLVLAPAVPWIGGLIVTGIGHYALPGREGREQALGAIGDAILGDEAQHMERAQQDADSRARPAVGADTCKGDCGDQADQDCLVGPYADIRRQCNQRGGEAHHVVPDMAYRLGPRPELEYQKNSTADRIPNAPTFNQGMSICLTPEQHGSGPTGIHGRLRGRLNGAGAASGVQGTAPMGEILAHSAQSINEVEGLADECKQEAIARTTTQVADGTGFAAPGRSRQSLPSGHAYTVLQRGRY